MRSLSVSKTKCAWPFIFARSGPVRENCPKRNGSQLEPRIMADISVKEKAVRSTGTQSSPSPSQMESSRYITGCRSLATMNRWSTALMIFRSFAPAATARNTGGWPRCSTLHAHNFSLSRIRGALNAERAATHRSATHNGQSAIAPIPDVDYDSSGLAVFSMRF